MAHASIAVAIAGGFADPEEDDRGGLRNRMNRLEAGLRLHLQSDEKIGHQSHYLDTALTTARARGSVSPVEYTAGRRIQRAANMARHDPFGVDCDSSGADENRGGTSADYSNTGRSEASSDRRCGSLAKPVPRKATRRRPTTEEPEGEGRWSGRSEQHFMLDDDKSCEEFYVGDAGREASVQTSDHGVRADVYVGTCNNVSGETQTDACPIVPAICTSCASQFAAYGVFICNVDITARGQRGAACRQRCGRRTACSRGGGAYG